MADIILNVLLGEVSTHFHSETRVSSLLMVNQIFDGI